MRRYIANFAIDDELLAALRRIKDKDGISVSEQVRRGIRLWLRQKGVALEADRRRGQTRRRS